MAGIILGGEASARSSAQSAASKRAPNFLFIMTDQQRWDALGAAGNKYMHTPNLDRLASQGVRFTNCYVAQAVCSPSRASIVSGLYPHAHKVTDNIYGIDDVTSDPAYNMAITWPLLLQRAGYRTCWIGKWHLGEKGPECFDEWHGFNSLLPHWLGKPYKSKYRCDDETDKGLKYLEDNRNRPFVLCQSYYPPHTPYTAPKRYWQYYEGAPLEPMEYYAACSDIDWNVGRLMAKLEDQDLLDNTFVIYTSDHGDHFGTRPGGGNKRGAYDDCAKVPLIAHHPSLASGGLVRNELVSNVDIMPTLLQIAGVDSPENLHGRSLLPLMRGAKVRWRDSVLIQNREAVGKEDKGGCSSRAVRAEEWKLIIRDRLSIRATQLREMYDMKRDPQEKKSVYGPERATEILPIVELLESWGRRLDDAESLELAAACRADLELTAAARS